VFVYQLSEATAAQRRVPLHLVDATDGITPETGESAGQPQLSKNGAAFGNTTATLVAVGNGLYYVELTAAELDTVGFLAVRYKSANTAEAQVAGQVVSYDPYAVLSTLDAAGIRTAVGLASANLDTQLLAIDDLLDTEVGAIKTDTAAIKVQTDKLTFTVANQIDANVLDWKSAVAPAMTGDAFARLGAPSGASVSADVAAIKVDTAAILVDTGTTLDLRIPAALVSGRMDSSVGAMAANVITATAINADAITDAKVAADVTIASVTGAVGSVTGAVGSVTGAVGSVTGNVGGNVVGSVGSVTGAVGSVTAAVTLPAIPANWITAAGIAADAIGASELAADAVTEIQSGLATAAALTTIDDFLDTEVAAILSLVDTEVAAIVSLLDDARAEPGQGNPPANPDALTKLDYLFKWTRNKKDNDGTTTNFYADDGVTVDHKQTVSEAAGTVTKGEIVTGL